MKLVQLSELSDVPQRRRDELDLSARSLSMYDTIEHENVAKEAMIPAGIVGKRLDLEQNHARSAHLSLPMLAHNCVEHERGSLCAISIRIRRTEVVDYR